MTMNYNDNTKKQVNEQNNSEALSCGDRHRSFLYLNDLNDIVLKSHLNVDNLSYLLLQFYFFNTPDLIHFLQILGKKNFF